MTPRGDQQSKPQNVGWICGKGYFLGSLLGTVGLAPVQEYWVLFFRARLNYEVRQCGESGAGYSLRGSACSMAGKMAAG